MDKADLRRAYEALKARSPQVYLREAAAQLGVSEMALLLLEEGKSVFRLQPAWQSLLRALSEQGELMGLSRNNWAVIENTGVYPEPVFEGSIAVLHGNYPALDLRCYLTHWTHAFAVSTQKGSRVLYSIQIFTSWGESIHKIYFIGPDSLQKWEALKEAFLHPEPFSGLEGIAAAPPSPVHEGPQDVESFLGAWAELKDTHDFFALLRRHRVSRLAAVRAAEGHFTWSLPLTYWEYFLHWVQSSQTPIIFFVGNAGIHQIYTGPVTSLTYERGWHNFHGPGLTLHFNPQGLGYLYLVRKPTREGDIYSLEVFSEQGEEVLWVFGARKPGTPVPAAWREFVASLQRVLT